MKNKQEAPSPNGNSKLVPFLARHESTGTIEPLYRPYDGEIPTKVWHMLNRQVLKLDSLSYFYPLDAMDAYQETILCLERKAAEMPQLNIASADTYLASTMKKCLLKFHFDKVLPIRENYRKTEDKIFTRDAVENCDRDDDGSISLQQLAEAIPGMPDAKERRRMATSAIEEILDALNDAEIARVFLAYILADGNFVEAAHLAHIGVNRFYAMWRFWLAAARRAAERINVRI